LKFLCIHVLNVLEFVAYSSHSVLHVATLITNSKTGSLFVQSTSLSVSKVLNVVTGVTSDWMLITADPCMHYTHSLCIVSTLLQTHVKQCCVCMLKSL